MQLTRVHTDTDVCIEGEIFEELVFVGTAIVSDAPREREREREREKDRFVLIANHQLTSLARLWSVSVARAKEPEPLGPQAF